MDATAIGRAVQQAGLAPPDLDGAEIVGQDPILRSPHHLGNGAAVARLLTGLAARDLWEQRTGRRQSIQVDARHAAAALTSFAHLELLDPTRRGAADVPRRNLRFTRIVPARDGRFVQLHGSFGDGPQLVDELGLDEAASSDDIDAAVARRDAFELEDACIRRRICGGVVRSQDEWSEHPQGRAVVALPVVTITKIGDAPPQPLPDGDRPTAGVRVLDLTRVLAGPTCAKTLAEHGADVLHVTAAHLPGTGPFDIETGIGKRQAELDLREPEAAATLAELLRTADVFSQGYRKGALARRGFGPEQAAERRPGIVYVSENCYGPVGPWAERPGWEQLAQAASGMSRREGIGSSTGAPRLAPAAVNDYTTGFLAAYGAMTALARRATEGGSWLVQASLVQTAMWYLRLGDDNDAGAAGIGDVDAFRTEMDTPDYGRIRFLAPALTMSETPPRWDLPPAPRGAHEPEWKA
jgi:CoA-transferase family III